MGLRKCIYPENFFCCNLDVGGMVIGWLSLIINVTLLVVYALLLSKTTSYDPNIYRLVFTTIVSISATNFVTNLILIIGIFMRRASLIVPFLVSEVLEILLTLAVLLFRGVIFYYTNTFQLTWYIPLGIAILFIRFHIWVCLVQLYKVYSQQQYELDEVNGKITVLTV